uniref:DUF19 domain-containing protein n=1 Tax=Heterorhabditis bacteriophora TaxID=37862 RepID=A0A1I7W7C1_HETBA
MEITSCGPLSDKICSTNSSSVFCHDIRREGLLIFPNLYFHKYIYIYIYIYISCGSLKAEYDQVCFTPPPPQALAETKAFCDAFVETCSNTLKTNLFTNLSEINVDYTVYCKQEKERFLFVCPKPLRFNTYAEQNDGHIYTREIETYCSKQYRTARSYCKHPALLKLPKYALPCAIYKYNCIDIFTRVIYG